jgi:hypothetical protein
LKEQTLVLGKETGHVTFMSVAGDGLGSTSFESQPRGEGQYGHIGRVLAVWVELHVSLLNLAPVVDHY